METELLDDILLSMVEGIGSRTYQRLLERFGSSTAILDASRGDLRGFDFLQKETADRLLTAREDYDPAAIAELCRAEGIDVISCRDERYPESLRTIHDPPPLLYVKGALLPRDAISLAVIGTRRPTPYGCRQAKRLTSALSKAGFTIISGLALGIDGVAHRTALDAGGRTVAVLGSGHLKMYPPEHAELADRISRTGGAVLSEYPPLHSSAKWTFPQRNRIVSGLSLGVLVIEAPVRSGAMISARLAGEQGRDLFAVPGSIESLASKGCHQLIRDGACPVDSIDDILNVLGPMSHPVTLADDSGSIRHPAESMLNDVEQKVLQYVDTKPTSVESIVTASGLTGNQVMAALVVLEDKCVIRRPGRDKVVRI